MLITADEVKARWPGWEEYCELEDSATTADEVLDIVIASAETELLEYVTVTEDTINDALERHLINIVKKHAFDLLHGDAVFERTPGIVQNYRDSVAMLGRYRDGAFAVPVAEDAEVQPRFNVTAKERRFNTWFHD